MLLTCGAWGSLPTSCCVALCERHRNSKCFFLLLEKLTAANLRTPAPVWRVQEVRQGVVMSR